MYITFNNKFEHNSIVVFYNNQNYTIAPLSSVEVPLFGNKVQFTAENGAFDLLDGFEEEKPETFKERVLMKLTKKLVEKIPEIVLNVKVTYEISNISGDVSVDFTEGTYVVGGSRLAEFLDFLPVSCMFPHIITSDGTVAVKKTESTNKKKYLRLYRNMLLFMNSGFILIDWFLFIPEYLFIKILSADKIIERCIKKLYRMSVPERILFMEKQVDDTTNEKHGCLIGIIKVLIVIAAFVLIAEWANSSDPNTIISEDFQSVVCFDETFVRIDSGLPEDAKKTFLEEYTAHYPIGEDEYDDSYNCYIYEDSMGNRYLWLQDDSEKEYKDYENPVVYKSIGEQETE